MMKTIRYFLAIFLLLVILLFGVLFCSESGLRFIGKAVTRYSGGMVSIGQVHGRLLDECTLKAISVTTPGALITIERAEWSWRPGRLLAGELRLATLAASGIQVTLKREAGTQSQHAHFVLPKILLPFPLVLENFLAERLTILNSDREQLIAIAKIGAGFAGDGRQLQIDRLAVEGPDFGFLLHGSVGAADELSVDLAGKWHLAGFGFHQLQGSFSAQGPVEAPHIEFGVNSSGVIRAALDVVNLLEEPRWIGKIEARGVDLSALILHCPQILLTTVDADMHGDFGHYRGRVKARGSWDTLQGMTLVGQIDGDGLGIDFESLRIEREDSVADAEKAKIDWRNIFGWEGRFSFKNIDPAVINELLPGKITTEFTSSGEVTENGVVASFDIAEMAGLVRGQNVSVRGNVSLNETDVHTDGLTVSSGDVHGLVHIDKAKFSWAQSLSWAAEIELENFDPVLLHPEMYGKVNAHFSGSGRQGEEGPEGHISVRDLSGSLRGHNLSGGGDIQLLGNTFSTTGLTLASGLSELTLKGRAGDNLGVSFAFSTPDISALVPRAAGKVAVHGSVSGDMSAPQISGEIEGAGLRYEDYTAGQLKAHAQAELRGGGAFSGKVEGMTLELSGAAVSDITIDLSGTLRDHTCIVTADAPVVQLQGTVLGGYDNGTWVGTFTKVELQVPGDGVWRQKQDTAVTLGNNIRVDEFCVENGQADMCLGGSLHIAEGGKWVVNGRGRSVPLDFVNNLHQAAIQLDGLIDWDLNAAGNEESVASARLQVTVPSISFPLDSEEPDTYPFGLKDSSVQLDLVGGNLHGSFTSLTKYGGRAAMEITVEDVDLFSESLQDKKLAGRFELENFDLGLVDGFITYGVEPAGTLNCALALGGTLGQPTAEGNAAIENGGIELLHQGVTLDEVTLSLSAQGQQAKVIGAATSGPGEMQITGNLLYGENGVGGTLDLRSQDFLLVDLPEYSFRVATDAEFNFNREGGKIRGRVEVPYGRVTPEGMVNSVAVSEDVVFVNGETEEEQAKGWPLVLDLDVILGDDVRLDGYGLTGRLGGRLQINSSKDNILAGKGQLDLLDGKFSLYGRTLDIERGRVLFTGGPLDNPGLDVRAQATVTDRQARGDGYTVGVDISGLVQDLQFTLFSDPYMDDTEILSLMVVGQSMAGVSAEQGNILQSAAASLGLKGGSKLVQGLGDMLPIDDLHLEGSSKKEDFSMVVGKRLTDDLYIGYDMNMFSQLGQFRVRYDLKKGFSVETRSSSEATGADLLYSFER